jgi:membrane-associated protease RseP (regulator of RpoE activity)
MKRLMLICLLGLGVPALAQTAQGEKEQAQAAAKREAEDAKTRAKLDEARARLDKAAREVAELSSQLGANVRHDIRFIDGGPRKAVLGIQVDPDSGKDGVRVLSVSPGGPAAEAGLRDSDVIVALDGVATTGGDSDRTLITQMRTVKPEQKVKVRVLREGRNKDFTVVARPMAFDERTFNVRVPDIAMARTMGDMPMIQHFRGFFPGDFGGLELASITPKLGAYFGVTEGVLGLRRPVHKRADGQSTYESRATWMRVSVQNEEFLRGAVWLVALMPDRARAIDALAKVAQTAATYMWTGEDGMR